LLEVGCGQPKQNNQFFLQKAKDLGDMMMDTANINSLKDELDGLISEAAANL
jgi:hypothetical protein